MYHWLMITAKTRPFWSKRYVQQKGWGLHTCYNAVWKKTLLLIFAVYLFMGLFFFAEEPTKISQEQEIVLPTFPEINEPTPPIVPIPVKQELPTTPVDNSKCWIGGARDFHKRPVRVLSNMRSPNDGVQEKRCDTPCIWEHGSTPNMQSMDGFVNNMFGAKIASTQSCGYQKIMTHSQESAAIYPRYKLDRYTDDSHLFMTTELKSNVTIGYYSWVEWKIMNAPQDKTEEALTATFISNCNDKSGRLTLLKQLEQYGVKIDHFGKCLHNKKEPPGGKVKVMGKYKFAIAFENSKYQDYVTEKYFQALTSGSVPIVMGAPNLKIYEPLNKSCIFAEDYASTEELARDLIRIGNDEQEYNSYLRYKTEGPSFEFLALHDISSSHSRCRVCTKLGDLFNERFGDLEAKVPAPSSHGEIIIRIRERYRFYFRQVTVKGNTVQDLHRAILDSFEGHQTLWADERPPLLLPDHLRIYRVYECWATMTAYDRLYSPGIQSDSDMSKLRHGAQYEVIFV